MLWVRHLPVRVSTVFRKLNYIYGGSTEYPARKEIFIEVREALREL